MKIILRKQNGRNDYEDVEVDSSDSEAIKAIKEHNKEINHMIYEEKKLMSNYSVGQVEDLIGHEFADEENDPLNKDKKQWYERKNVCFEKYLKLLPKALSTLTDRQKEVYTMRKVQNLSYRKIAENLGLKDHKNIRDIYETADKKLKSFFREFKELEEFYPNLFKD